MKTLYKTTQQLTETSIGSQVSDSELITHMIAFLVLIPLNDSIQSKVARIQIVMSSVNNWIYKDVTLLASLTSIDFPALELCWEVFSVSYSVGPMLENMNQVIIVVREQILVWQASLLDNYVHFRLWIHLVEFKD